MAMAPHQAQRTLVKSRPELWAEVSDVESLCKHLGEFGEITITRLEPETTVAWEGTAARGTVELEASGWGTKVTLTAELVEPEADAAAPAVAETAFEPVAQAQAPAVVQPEPEPVVATEPEAQPLPAAAPDEADAVAEAEAVPTASPAAAPPARARRPGFFARLLGRKVAPAAAPEPTPAERAAARDAARAAATPAAAAEQPQGDPDPPLVAGAPAAAAAPVLDAGQALAVLTAALDDLGAAHRRPFSRS